MFNFQNFCIFGMPLTQRISISQVWYECLEFEILENPKQYEMIYMGLIPKVTIYLLYSWKSVKAYFSITFKSITSKTKAAVWTKAQTLVLFFSGTNLQKVSSLILLMLNLHLSKKITNWTEKEQLSWLKCHQILASNCPQTSVLRVHYQVQVSLKLKG